MRTIHIAITAAVPARLKLVTNDELGELVKTLLDIGQADATETLNDGEGNLADARRAAAIRFQSITVCEG
jgi:hypothetical protein